MTYKYLLFIVALLSLHLIGSAQEYNSQRNLPVKGIAKDISGKIIADQLIVINQKKNLGVFGDLKGGFEINALSTDTLLINARGYKTLKFCVQDKMDTNQFITVTLQPLAFRLNEIRVFPERSVKEIENDIKKLGYNEKEYMLNGVNAMSSPITYLYMQFSRHEKSNREALRLENEDRKKALLKELLAKYVDDGIFEMEDSELNDFIDFCNVKESYLKNTSQYEFILFLREAYIRYRKSKDYFGK